MFDKSLVLSILELNEGSLGTRASSPLPPIFAGKMPALPGNEANFSMKLFPRIPWIKW